MNIYAIKKPKRINAVSVTLTLLLLGGAYAAWAFVPVLFPLWRMNGLMRIACAKAHNDPNDAAVIADLVKRAQTPGLSISDDNFLLERTPFSSEELGGQPAAVATQMSKIGKGCVMRFRYVDTYTLPVLGREYTLPYESSVEVNYQGGDKNQLNDLVYNSCSCTSVRSNRRGAR